MPKTPFDITLRDRELSLVLLDIIGSTAFVQQAGRVRAAKWLQYHDRLARNLIYRFNGREIDRSDGFLLSFEQPIDALNFALQYQRTVPQKTKLQARIGVHTGLVVEVQQDELMVGIGAKGIELEGVAKNIAARVMSLCQEGQVLITKTTMSKIKNRTNAYTPKGTRFACVGLYKFKGVREAYEVYAVGESIESLQPPPDSDKVKRLGGPKYIKSRARDRKVKEWIYWFFWKFAFLVGLYWVYLIGYVFIHKPSRTLFGLYGYEWIDRIVKMIQRL